MTSESNSSAQRGRLAGIDYGTVRVGVALTDFDQRYCSPHEIYNRRTLPLDAAYFKKLVKEERVILFVVGLPTHLDGYESAKSLEVRKFGKWLTEQTGLSVEYTDERYSSVEADNLLRDAGLKASERKKKLDMLAAQILLSSYLEQRAARQADPTKNQSSSHNAEQSL
jgi:putative Holliday junction resolvase